MKRLTIENYDGMQCPVIINEDANLSLAKTLKDTGYAVFTLCNGTNTCITCHVLVIKGWEKLPQPDVQEQAMIAILKNAEWNSRLACRINTKLIPGGTVFKVMRPE